MKRLQFSQGRFLKEFSTFGIGGPIRYFAEVSTVDEMKEALVFAFQKKLPYLVIGKGSNCLFSDLGFDGVVLLNKIDFCKWNGPHVEAGAGFSFSLLGVQSARKGFSGLEFAAGIPASVGGAVFMNAGANGHETKDFLSYVGFLQEDGAVRQFSKEELVFSYRKSSFQEMKGVIVYAGFALNECQDARNKQLSIIDYRMQTQPLKEKSAGCVFRNPKEGSAGALIDKCGLKGLRYGGAKVSEVHGNFLINESRATSEDVLQLIRIVQEKVKERTGVLLETEIRVL